jgi:hypothetical protein
MSNTIKRLTIGLAAVATMALAAPAASAQVEVTDELGNHCSEVTNTGGTVTGGCEIHLVNEGQHVELIQHPTSGGPDVIVFDCDYEFRAHIGEDGEGWIDEIEISLGETASCGAVIRECRSGDPEAGGTDEPWHAQIDETAEGIEHANLEICLLVQPAFPSHAGSFDLTGHLELDLTGVDGVLQSGEAEDATLTEQSPPPQILGAQDEIDGHWHVEPLTPSIIINHPVE